MNRLDIVNWAIKQLGKPYIFGADVIKNIKLDDPDPPAFDCSLFTEMAYWQGAKLILPRYSEDQFLFCKDTDNPLPGDLGFFANGKNVIYHVGMIVDNGSKVIEARAHQDYADFETGKVILRPLIVWSNFQNHINGHHFAGWKTHPKFLDETKKEGIK